ncbi:MAG: protein-L-isoaspartate O-methyltransferase [Erythrobacter sp.]|nr:protein-L-isoaspartate O-methyltransferase [Erythrobacter sp.]
MTTTTARPDYAAARKAMLDSQLRTSGVNEAFVLERMGTVPREDFVPENAKGTAYMDRAIRLADGGFLPAPLFHGSMLSEARPTTQDKVLVIEGGSGYLATLVDPLVSSVTSISPAEALEAKKGKYSLILVDGAIEHVPDNIAKMLDADGRIVTGLVERGVTRLATGRKTGKTVALLRLAEMGIPRMGEFDKPASWSF